MAAQARAASSARVVLRLGDGDDAVEVRCTVDPEHEAQLTRDDDHRVGALRPLRPHPAQVEAFAAGPVALVVDHPEYRHEIVAHRGHPVGAAGRPAGQLSAELADPS